MSRQDLTHRCSQCASDIQYITPSAWFSARRKKDLLCVSCKDLLGESKKQPELKDTQEKVEITDPLTCRECNKEFLSVRDKNKHIKEVHQKTLQQYYIDNYLEGVTPTCQCGCGRETKLIMFSDCFIYSKYTKNHFPKKPFTQEQKQKVKENTRKAIKEKYGVDHIFQLPEFQKKLKRRFKEKHGVRNPMQRVDIQIKRKENCQEKYGEGILFPPKSKSFKDSKIEVKVRKAVKGEKYFIDNKEFDIKVGNTLIEVDGDYWHPNTLNNLSFSQLHTKLNDWEKEQLCKKEDLELIRIHESGIPENITLDTLRENSYLPDYTLTPSTVILSKEYLSDYRRIKGVDKLERYVPLLYKFIQTFSPELPTPHLDETLEEIIQKIQHFDYSKLESNPREFNNKQYNLGSPYLKGIFKSYWKSSYRNSISPFQAWNNPEVMKKVIKDRIGVNKRGEVFNFSLKDLVRGLTVHRYSVSFFKPLLAAAIYRSYLGDKLTPTVFDPCSGFGGRLLGFKALYPQGTYIGVEPNPETYKELLTLVEQGNFTNVKIYNCKIEDLKETVHYDFAFTSIPYFDLEEYSNGSGAYSSFEEWEDTFIRTLLSYDNLLININIELYEKLSRYFQEEGRIYSNTSPFQSRRGKHEVLVRKI